MNSEYEGGSTITINGMEMYFEARGRGEPLLLLHGFTGSGADWSLIFADAPEGFQLIIPDLRGHGRSTNPLPEFTHRQAALDVFGLLNHLEIERFKAIGLSAGAGTLLHMATQQPLRAESLVLVSGAPYFPEQARALMAHSGPDNRTAEEWQTMRRRHRRGDDQIRTLWSQASAFKDSYDDMNFTPPDLSTIKARTLIVHGDRDQLYPVELAVAMLRAIPRSYLWVVPNGGHGPIFGDLAPRFVETALAFLRDELVRKIVPE